MRSNLSHAQILSLPSDEFLKFLDQYNQDIELDMDDENAMNRTSKLLGRYSNIYAYLCSLAAYAGVYKRALSKEKDKTAYQDMIDKESAINLLLKAIDLQYKAISKVISAKIEANKELYYTDGKQADSYRNRR